MNAQTFKQFILKVLIYSALFDVFPYVASAQNIFPLKVTGDSLVFKMYKKNKTPQNFRSIAELEKSVSRIIFYLNTEGFFAAGVDSIYSDSTSKYIYHLTTGKKYSIRSIQFNDSLLPFSIELLKKSASPSVWIRDAQHLLSSFENNGYPFAHIQLNPSYISDSTVDLNLTIQKNKYIIFDTFDIVGNAQTNKKYLEHYLGIKHGEAYSEEAVASIDKKLQELPWVEVMKPSEIYFIGNKALLRLYINKRQAGSIDAVLGLAPASELNNEQLLITGEGHLKLPNLLSRGYALDLDYTSYRTSSREFKARSYIPYVLGTAIGVEGNFNLVKFDSLYLDVTSDIGLLYQLNATEYIRIYYKKQSVSLLQVDTQELIQTQKLPDFNDITLGRYGIYIRRNKLNNSRNPLKGWSLDIDVSAGIKKIIEVEGIKQLGIYNGLTLKSVQYQSNMTFRWFVPLGKSLTWHTQLKMAQIYTPQIFYNDLYRIGGLKTLRGFDEQSILASSYILGNMEVRYLFGKYSNALIFCNGGWWENNAINIYKNGKPIGLGFGSNLETKAGIFSIYYALGKEIGQPFLFKNGKVHFGLVSYF